MYIPFRLLSLEMPVPSQGHCGFPVFRLSTDFVCLLTYEFCLSLGKIARYSVILLLPLFSPKDFIFLGFPVSWLWAYLMTIIPETSRVQYTMNLCFYYMRRGILVASNQKDSYIFLESTYDYGNCEFRFRPFFFSLMLFLRAYRLMQGR